ncbi:MAG TPA: hypothetical protein VJR46_10255 [Candidatus Dormibacteraeota bacterium]|nr:hypothetical protein [Candidatus Dormibacteraeota bacterium]
MPELEDRLTALGAEIAWPPTPPRLWRGDRQRRAEGLFARPRWALAAAAVLLIVATLLAYTPTRDAIAHWLNLHTTFTRTEHPPTPSPLPSGPLGQRLDLGKQTTLAGAQQQLNWKIVVPAALGAPDEVYLKLPPDGPSGGEVTLVYGARSDIRVSGITGVSVLVTEARGRTNEQFFQKTLGPDVKIEPVTVGGHSGYWISGQPHQFAFTDADGNPYFDTLRLATNTLILDDGGTVVRVEGDMTKQQAIDIGRSLA